MTGERVTVVSCVLNEAASIRPLMDSLLIQTRPPEEILVVDGGSKDGTLDFLGQYATHEPRLRIVHAPGTNIAQARNIAFREAHGDVVASIDGGCVARPDWLENLLGHLDTNVDIVSGVYLANPSSEWERVMEEFFYPDISKLPDDWQEPAHNSVLIRRRVWESVGPFPERLYRSEDSWFNSRAVNLGFRFRTARDAAVYRKPRQSQIEVFQNTWAWVQSDIENDVNMPFELERATRIAFRLVSKVLALVLWLGALAFSPLAGILTLPLAGSALVKVSHRMKSLRYVILYNTVDYVVMIASVGGGLIGSFRRVRRSNLLHSTR